MRIIKFFFLAIFCLSSFTANAQRHVFTIVLDPGHGGKDSGAIGEHGEREKYVVLGIAKKIAGQLSNMHDVRVILTRKRDVYLPLRTRLAIARKNNADLFIAIHADAYFNRQAKGASVYALSQHGATSEAIRWLVQQEKYSELDGIAFNHLPDHSQMLRSVLIDMAQTATIRDSVLLGNRVLKSLHTVTRLHFRRVTSAPFVVLKSPDIPSILVETGFISNPQEAAELINPAYQEELAAAISQGVRGYMLSFSH